MIEATLHKSPIFKKSKTPTDMNDFDGEDSDTTTVIVSPEIPLGHSLQLSDGRQALSQLDILTQLDESFPGVSFLQDSSLDKTSKTINTAFEVPTPATSKRSRHDLNDGDALATMLSTLPDVAGAPSVLKRFSVQELRMLLEGAGMKVSPQVKRKESEKLLFDMIYVEKAFNVTHSRQFRLARVNRKMSRVTVDEDTSKCTVDKQPAAVCVSSQGSRSGPQGDVALDSTSMSIRQHSQPDRSYNNTITVDSSVCTMVRRKQEDSRWKELTKGLLHDSLAATSVICRCHCRRRRSETILIMSQKNPIY